LRLSFWAGYPAGSGDTSSRMFHRRSRLGKSGLSGLLLGNHRVEIAILQNDVIVETSNPEIRGCRCRG
jgi:hypothetical protein